ncbi:hypothetical protein [Streptomyces sp. NPDC001933]|uniref:hypothetical protein n=1 Tax=Streptomyces sp. NPDC001933 TaxID=3364626 RepID=UPI0036C01B8B
MTALVRELCSCPAHPDLEFPAPVGKHSAAFLYRVGGLKKWARNRPRANTTDLD